MSNRFQDGRQQTGAGNTGDITRLFSQMMTMPMSLFMYSIDMLVQMMQGMTGMAGQGMGAMTGGRTAAQTLNSATGYGSGSMGSTGVQPIGGSSSAGSAQANQQATRMEDRTMSQQNWSSSGGGGSSSGGMGQGWGSGGDQGWSMRDDCAETERCDRLRLVRYKVLFLKRDLEVAFPEQEELVVEEMPRDGFISWKVAEFIQQMSRGEVPQPGKWKEKGYPSNTAGGKVEYGNVLSLPDKDKRFLRVYCQVLEWYDRERMNYERDQVDVLREIREEIKKLRPDYNPSGES